jgi:hypothetical protein
MSAHPSPSRAVAAFPSLKRRLVRRLKVLFWQLRDRLQPPSIAPWPDDDPDADQAYAEYESPS